MRYYEFLFEYSRDITKRQYGNKIVEKLRSGPDKDLFDYYYKTLSDRQYPIEKITDTIAQNLLSSFENNDPTPNNQYTPWIAREYIKGHIRRLEDLDRISNGLKLYHQYKNTRQFKDAVGSNPVFKDIMKLEAETLLDVAEKIESYVGTKSDTQAKKGQAKEVYQDSEVRVIVPLDQDAACYYGQGTRWCTAATQGQNYFEHYNSEGPLYIIIPKKPEYPGEKYQLHVYEEQFMNEKDNPVGLNILNRYPKFVEYLKTHEPSITDVIDFADPNILADINKTVAEQIVEWTFDELNDWEMQDDSWNEVRAEAAIEKGYVDEEGNVDWDRVHEDPQLNDYFEYNDEARQIYNAAKKIETWTPNQIVSSIEDYSPEGNWYTMENLDDLYANYAQENLTDNVQEKISKKLYITNQPNRYKGISNVLGTFGDYTVGVVTHK